MRANRSRISHNRRKHFRHFQRLIYCALKIIIKYAIPRANTHTHTSRLKFDIIGPVLFSPVEYIFIILRIYIQYFNIRIIYGVRRDIKFYRPYKVESIIGGIPLGDRSLLSKQFYPVTSGSIYSNVSPPHPPSSIKYSYFFFCACITTGIVDNFCFIGDATGGPCEKQKLITFRNRLYSVRK